MSDTVNPLSKEFEGKRALTTVEAARYIGMSEQYLKESRLNGVQQGKTPGPRFMRKGPKKRLIRYLKDDLDKWLEEGLVETPKIIDPEKETYL